MLLDEVISESGHETTRLFAKHTCIDGVGRSRWMKCSMHRYPRKEHSEDPATMMYSMRKTVVMLL